jgi:hypothetical protein
LKTPSLQSAKKESDSSQGISNINTLSIVTEPNYDPNVNSSGFGLMLTESKQINLSAEASQRKSRVVKQSFEFEKIDLNHISSNKKKFFFIFGVVVLFIVIFNIILFCT